jgi:hypothetical protein
MQRCFVFFSSTNDRRLIASTSLLYVDKLTIDELDRNQYQVNIHQLSKNNHYSRLLQLNLKTQVEHDDNNGQFVLFPYVSEKKS